MDRKHRMKLSGILFLAAGGIFFATAAAAHQVAFHGVGAAFVGVAVALLAQSKKQE